MQVKGFMVSDIKGFDSRQTPGARTGETGVVRADPRAGAGRQAGSAARDDTVELSGVADLIATAVRKLAAEPAVDQARVQEIRKAIASGSYTVDPERIARKLIDADSQY